MSKRVRQRQARIYAEMWRAYYAIIIAGSGGCIAYFGARSGNFLFALGIVILTIVAITVLFVLTFRRARRRAAIPSDARRLRR